MLDYIPRVLEQSEIIDKKNYSEGSFVLDSRGMGQKTTGSYYTDKRLINEIINSTLKPLLDNILASNISLKEKEEAILNLKVCDPACGSGAFLIAANNFLGKILAQIRTNLELPSERDERLARREILGNCIYGVDLNPMAIELVKVSLWINALVRDLPLNYLDHHLKCGNSLIGTTPALIDKGILNNAFKVVKGERKEIVNKLKDINKKQKQVKFVLDKFVKKPNKELKIDEFDELSKIPEITREDVVKKRKKHIKIIKSESFQNQKLIYDTWCAIYFWPFIEKFKAAPTQGIYRLIMEGEINKINQSILTEINELSTKINFFHWNLEFPEVFSSNKKGFDCLIGNPPWDVLTLKKSEFFSKYDIKISKAETKEKLSLIEKLKIKNPELYRKFDEKRIEFEKMKNFFKNSGNFLLTSNGSLDLYALFTELGYNLINNQGSIGLICPIGIIYSYPKFFDKIISTKHLRKCIGFINLENLFPSVASLKQFVIINLLKNNLQLPLFTFNLRNFDEANDLNQYFKIEPDDLSLINPNTKTPPFPNNQIEYDIIKKIYSNSVCQLKNIQSKKSRILIHRMFHISDDRKKKILFFKEELISKGLKLNETNMQFFNENKLYLPVYEGKLIFQYDYLYGTYKNVPEKVRKSRRARCLPNENKNLECVETRYWAEKKHFFKKIENWNYNKNWFLVYRDSTGPKNNRSMVFTIIPWLPTVYTLYNFINITAKEAIIYISQFNSFILDFIFRKKMATNHLTQMDISQLPFLSEDIIKKHYELIKPLVLELLYTNHTLDDFAKELNFFEEIFSWDDEKRFDLMRRLDAIYAVLFKLTKNEIRYILEDFNVLKKREIELYGEFKWKNNILKYYDEYTSIMS